MNEWMNEQRTASIFLLLIKASSVSVSSVYCNMIISVPIQNKFQSKFIGTIRHKISSCLWKFVSDFGDSLSSNETAQSADHNASSCARSEKGCQSCDSRSSSEETAHTLAALPAQHPVELVARDFARKVPEQRAYRFPAEVGCLHDGVALQNAKFKHGTRTAKRPRAFPKYKHRQITIMRSTMTCTDPKHARV